MSTTGSSGSLLEHYAGIRSAVNTIRTRLVDLLTGLSNRALHACFNTHHSPDQDMWLLDKIGNRIICPQTIASTLQHHLHRYILGIVSWHCFHRI